MKFRYILHLYITLSLKSYGMNRFFIYSIFILFALGSLSNTSMAQDSTSYEAAWKRVDRFREKDLPKSIMAEVRKIYAKAKKEKRDDQVIKALIYADYAQQYDREDHDILTIQEI